MPAEREHQDRLQQEHSRMESKGTLEQRGRRHFKLIRDHRKMHRIWIWLRSHLQAEVE